MDRALQVLIDKQSIYEVLATYCRGVDRCDEAIVRSAYHADSYDDHGYWKGNGHEFAGFVTARLMQANICTTHSITNVLIEVDGDRAWSEAQVVTTLVRRGTEPPETDVMGARYVDELSRRDGVWRLNYRSVVLDWHHRDAWNTSATAMPLESFQRGARGTGDPIYAYLNGKAAA